MNDTAIFTITLTRSTPSELLLGTTNDAHEIAAIVREADRLHSEMNAETDDWEWAYEVLEPLAKHVAKAILSNHPDTPWQGVFGKAQLAARELLEPFIKRHHDDPTCKD